jgi:hypothetical protein
VRGFWEHFVAGLKRLCADDECTDRSQDSSNADKRLPLRISAWYPDQFVRNFSDQALSVERERAITPSLKELFNAPAALT